MHFATLSSGSKGNALYVESESAALLIDCGIPAKKLRARMQSIARSLADVSAICVTHSHGDHTASVGKVASAYKMRVYASEGTLRGMSKRGGLPNFVKTPTHGIVLINGFRVETFRTPHDAPGSMGFVIEHEGERLGICTDLGSVTTEVVNALSSVDTLYLEFNYDEAMLKGGPYPPRLKRRILGDRGHLSNAQSAELLQKAYSSRLKRCVLAHLSETNNNERLAMEAAVGALKGTKTEIVIAPQHYAQPLVQVGQKGAALCPKPNFAENKRPSAMDIATRVLEKKNRANKSRWEMYRWLCDVRWIFLAAKNASGLGFGSRSFFRGR